MTTPGSAPQGYGDFDDDNWSSTAPTPQRLAGGVNEVTDDDLLAARRASNQGGSSEWGDYRSGPGATLFDPYAGMPDDIRRSHSWVRQEGPSLWLRLAARVIDAIVLTPVFLVIAFIASLGLAATDAIGPAGFSIAGQGVLYVVCFGVYAAYEVVMHSVWGSTVGKFATGLRVVSTRTSSNPSFAVAGLRFGFELFLSVVASLLAWAVSLGVAATGVPQLVIAGLLLGSLIRISALVIDLRPALLDPAKRMMHDNVAGTVVTRR